MPLTILASDIDNTLTGDQPALDQLTPRLNQLRQRKQLFLILSTGRLIGQVIDGFKNENLAPADAVISMVGTEIYLPPYSPQMSPLSEWDQQLESEFSRQQALQFIQNIKGLQLQPEQFNSELKVSCYLDQTINPDQLVQLIKQRIKSVNLNSKYQVIWSSGCDLDIVPASAGKGNAIKFLLKHLALQHIKVIVAGDSGNDSLMFSEFKTGIAVANSQSELLTFLHQHPEWDIYFAKQPCAAGVLEGLKHFGII